MKRIRFLSFNGNSVDPATRAESRAVVPGGQILGLSMVAGTTNGSWLKIGESGPIFVPPGMTLSLDANAFGYVPQRPGVDELCDRLEFDQYPGDDSIEVVFGQAAAPSDVMASDEPQSWILVYNG